MKQQFECFLKLLKEGNFIYAWIADMKEMCGKDR